MLSYSFLSNPADDATTPASDLSTHYQTVARNMSLSNNDCITIVLSQMKFIPWDNPDNVLSERTETIVRHFKNNLLVLLFVIGGPANLLNMAVFWKQGLDDRVNLCLFALSMADEVYLTISLLIHGEQLHIQFTTKERFGPIVTFLTNNNVLALKASSYISHALSAILAAERCVCVLNPLKFQTLMRTGTMAAIVVTVSVVMVSLYFIVVFRYRIGCFRDAPTGVVITTLIEGRFYLRHKDIIGPIQSVVFGFGLPAVEMTLVTTATLITIVKLRQAATWRSETSSLMSAKELALTKILVGNSIFFVACITPVTLILFGNLFVPEMNSGRRLHNLSLVGVWFIEIFSAINATFNFFVYYVMGSRYRQTFWALFGRKGKAAKS